MEGFVCAAKLTAHVIVEHHATNKQPKVLQQLACHPRRSLSGQEIPTRLSPPLNEGTMRMKPVITLDDAKKMLAVAEAEAARNKWEVVIAILNDGGRMVVLHRMDGARPGNDEIAIAKATTSAMTCRPSAVWERWIEGPHKAYATFPFLAVQGGLPIIIDGELIGAIGVSGVKSFQDEQIALAAIRAVFPQAKAARAGEESDGQAL